MSDETTLLPCPFCGGEADEYEGDYGNGIYCMMCGAIVGEPIHLEYRTTKRVGIDEAIVAWNTRAELGSGTCENANKDGYGFRFDCTECGYSTIVLNCATRLDELPSFCPKCGKRVKR